MSAAKKGNGHDPQTERMIEVLEAIKAELSAFREETRGELTDIRGEIATVRGDVGQIRSELREIHHEIAETNTRISVTNERLAELRADVRGAVETRLLRLEQAVFKRASGEG